MMYEVKDFLKQKLLPTTAIAAFGVLYLLLGIFAIDYLVGFLELEIETKWVVLSSAIVSAASLLTLRQNY
ncbi:MAG: hypothetical protein GOU98_02520 [Candidatus Altiarchaeota archaeon]|nr:hypothetical protein [Candidatus Altiarchaeota archaeon]